MPSLMEKMFLPTSTAPNGIHVSAELRINAMQLRAYRIGWAAECMERAAKHIDALEDERMKQLEKEQADAEGGATNEQPQAGGPAQACEGQPAKPRQAGQPG